ncbi:hypothetical protein F5B19DRAFT_447593 [Rostrohypoxylon terebratum]|nr:hypothetical protein F5B19DRAFT_447593 [Rostrohypoxylon terebratum]
MEPASVEDRSSQASSSRPSSTANLRQGVISDTSASSVSQHSTESIVGNPTGSVEYTINLRRNRIFRDVEMYPRPPIPPFVIELHERIKQPRDYPHGRRYADRKLQLALEDIPRLKEHDDNSTFGSYWSYYLPLSRIVYKDIYLETTGLDIRNAWFLNYGKHCNTITQDSVLGRHLSRFPSPAGLEHSTADITNGYGTIWLFNLLNGAFSYDNEYARSIRSMVWDEEVPLFPYLFVEHKSGSNDDFRSANNRLQTVCSAYLSGTRELIRTNNVVFGLSIVDDIAQLHIMCMEGTQESTIFIQHFLDHFWLIQAEDLTRLQDVLMRVHDWGLQERRVEIEREIMDHIFAQENGTTRPRPNFESDFTYEYQHAGIGG